LILWGFDKLRCWMLLMDSSMKISALHHDMEDSPLCSPCNTRRWIHSRNSKTLIEHFPCGISGRESIWQYNSIYCWDKKQCRYTSSLSQVFITSCLIKHRDIFTLVVTYRTKTKTKLHGLSSRVNYTDRATAACRRSDCQLLADRGYNVASVTAPYSRILGFVDSSRYFSIK
jgi:hypothetical protein